MATNFLSATNRIFRVIAMPYVSTTVTPNGATTDIGTLTLNTATTTLAAPSGTPYDGQQLVFRLTQDGTGGRLVTWNAIYAFSGGGTPTLSTAAGSTDIFAFQYNSATSKWECLAGMIDDAPAPGQVVGKKMGLSDSVIFDDDPVVRIISARAPVKAGRTYNVYAYGELVTNGAAGAFTVESTLRYTINDTEPLVSSPQLGRAESHNDSTLGVPRTVLVRGIYEATTDHIFRVALCSERVEGSVNVVWTGGPGRPVMLIIEDMGATVTDDGTYYT